MSSAKRVAVIGSGISGLGASLRLQSHCEVVLFEADARAGGHAHTVDITLEGMSHPVDTGFLVFNHRTYPKLLNLFSELSVKTAKSEMSFSVSMGPIDGPRELEWCGSNIASLFAQTNTLWSPSHWRMIKDILRFNRQGTALASTPEQFPNDSKLTLRAFLAKYNYSQAFSARYLLPMAAAIWSSPISETLDFPVLSFLRFCKNHGLLQIMNRPQWYTVEGGSRNYVNAVLNRLSDVRLSTPVRAVRTLSDSSYVVTDSGSERFDAVILACHSDQALALISEPSEQEKQVLGAIPYQENIAWLHTDTRLMPQRKAAWAAWNYLSDGKPRPTVSLSYWLNRLQPLPFKQDVFVSLNPPAPPRSETVHRRLSYAHPLLGQSAVAAQSQLASIQGQRGRWFAGAWAGYGFHEDGLSSGLAAAELVLKQFGRTSPLQAGSRLAA